MAEKKELYEQYEEAFFAVLMDQIADAEGEKLLEENQLLQDDPAAAIPAETTRRCLRLIRRQSHKAQRQRTARRSMRIIARIAVVLMSLVVLYAVAFAASETVRVHTLNFLVQELDVGTQYLFPGDESEETNEDFASQILSIVKENVPTDFSYVSREENPLISIFYFENAAGDQITVKYWNLEGASANITIDTEHAEVSKQVISGQEVMIVSKDYSEAVGQPEAVFQIVWVCEEQEHMMQVKGINVQLDDILPVAENLIQSLHTS